MVPIQRILVPTDFSEPADAAVKWATTLAHEFNAELHILHVVPEPYMYPWGTELTSVPINEILVQAEQAADERLRQVVAEAGAGPKAVHGRALIGSPVDVILGVAADERIDLIVLGTHGRGMVGHLLLGSVAERVVRRSPVPVLTVHGEKRSAELKASGLTTAKAS